MTTYQAGELVEFAAEFLRKTGAPEEVAAEVSAHLVRSNLSGHDSHGVNRIPQLLAEVDAGEIVPTATPEIIRESPSTVLIDARRGYGHYSTAFALDQVVARAKEHGVAVAAVRHSTHLGRLGEYTERAAQQGIIGLVTAGGAGLGLGWMKPPGGRRRFVGANPWSIGVPAESVSVVFDGSMTNVAQGKVNVARSKSEPVPLDWVVDSDGNSTTDPTALYRDGALVPLGGSVAGHKGYSLGLMSALLGGLSMIDDPDPTSFVPRRPSHTAAPDEAEQPWMSGVFLLAVNPGFFGSASDYAAKVESLREGARVAGPASDQPRPVLPGEPEAARRAQLESTGIDVPEKTVQDLAEIAERFGISLPKPSEK